MDRRIKKIGNEIKELKIQGARNVAKAVINALKIYVKDSKTSSISKFYNGFKEVAEYLYKIRPTEPMTRNSIERILNYAHMLITEKKSKKRTIGQIKEKLIEKEDELLNQMKTNRDAIAKYGSKLIKNGMTVMTYCHSSTVTNLLKTAHKKGKKFEVISCETRPVFQGRITSKELVNAGIKTTMIVDGAMNKFMKDVDLVIVGCDAITSKGDLINKIGTSTLAHIAYAHDVPFYSSAELFKFDPLTLFGSNEKIEERDPKEVWEKPPRKLKIRNPAFDLTFAKYISAYITEAGIIAPQSLFNIVREMYHIPSR